MRFFFFFTGVEGTVKNAKSEPMYNATIRIQNVGKTFYVSKTLAYFKLLLPPGNYTINVMCHKYQTAVFNLAVEENKLAFIDAILTPETSSAEGGSPSPMEGGISSDNMQSVTGNF